jgi:hypothetical protein
MYAKVREFTNADALIPMSPRALGR